MTKLEAPTIQSAEPLADAALATLAPAASSAYFLDVDGTLLDIKEHPGDVVADPELLDLLVRLHEKCGGALALVSGRTVHDIDRIFAPVLFPAAGAHGALLRFGDGSTAEVKGDVLRDIAPIVAAFVDAHPDLLFEDKGAALTVHFRQNPDLRPKVLDMLASCAVRSDLVVLEGKMVAELKLSEFNKGTAIGTFMGLSPFYGRKPVFVGDDITDEYGFDAVNQMSGLSIRVDRFDRESKARCRVLTPSTLRAQLFSLLAQM